MGHTYIEPYLSDKDLDEFKYTTMNIINDRDEYKPILKSWLCYH